jgi:hexosaminidase
MTIKMPIFLLMLILIIGFNYQISARPRANVSATNAEITVVSESNTMFRTQIILHVAENYADWRFGFFMFHILSNPHKPKTIQICKLISSKSSSINDKKHTSNCVTLAIDANPYPQTINQFIQSDLSLGHVTILKPQTKFNLQRGENYMITIKGLNNIPQNISAMPQKLFIYDIKPIIASRQNPSWQSLTNIAVNSYSNTAYNKLQIESQINAQIVANWNAAKQVNVLSPILPTPQYLSYNNLHSATLDSYLYKFNKKLKVYAPNQALKRSLASVAKWQFTTSKADANIRLLACSQHLKLCDGITEQPEGYVITVTKTGVDIYSNNQIGWFYGAQTVLQLLDYGKTSACSQSSNTLEICHPRVGTRPPGEGGEVNLPFLTIVDYPRFKYRGIMLDTVRHFFPYNELKNFIDVMAAHKLNTLHLHLADDEGWRLELPHYPELTKIGGTRGLGQRIGAANLIDDKYDISNLSKQKYINVNAKYTGYYTVKQIKNLIKYANIRGITIIPEIEMPGHARAMKKAMPEVFFDAADKTDAYSVQGYNDNVLPACKYGVNAKFTQAINGVIQDIAKLFARQTTPYFVKNEVSLSGDELAEGSLSGYPLCKKGIWANLSTIQIEHMFFKQLANQLPGYKLSGWQQLVQNDNGIISQNVIAANNVGHIWAWMPTNSKPMNGYDMVTNLTKLGYNTVLAFADYAYFDIRYSPRFTEPGLYWSTSYIDTHKALQIGKILSKNLPGTNKVDGLEGALWSELLASNEHLWYMALPKMSALAEAAWSNESDLNWRSLANRLGCGKSGFLAYLSKNYNVKYRGYPNGIKLEVPPNTICKSNSTAYK